MSVLSKSSIVACAALLAGGCHLWTTESPNDQTQQLPVSRMSPDSVVLEIAFVHVPPDVKQLAVELWQEVDEQHLPNDLRRSLRANGFRTGVVGSPLPGPLQELLDHKENDEHIDSDVGALRLGVGSTRRKLQCRAGQRNKIVTSQTRPQMAIMINDNGKIRGETCTQAHCEFALKAFPQGNARVRLELTPEIHHGQPRPIYVGSDNAFRMETAQERLIVDKLKIDTELSLGETLVLSCTPEITGLGGKFFANRPADDAHPKLILIRLARTQFDDLFAPDEMVAPITTPAE